MKTPILSSSRARTGTGTGCTCTARTGTGRRRGFSLIELLVVIVIIAVLVTLFFYGAEKIHNRTNNVLCMNSIRQVGKGVEMYMIDNGETPKMDSSGWYGYGVSVDADWGNNWNTQLIRQGFAERGVFFCPLATIVAPLVTNPDDKSTSSAYGLQLIGVPAETINNFGPNNLQDDAHSKYVKLSTVPLVSEYMAVHSGGKVQACFLDGSVDVVNNASKSYAPVDFEPGQGGNVLIYFRK